MIRRIVLTALACTVLAGVPLGTLPAPAHAQGYYNNANVHWGPRTRAQDCRGDRWGHFWGRDRRSTIAPAGSIGITGAASAETAGAAGSRVVTWAARGRPADPACRPLLGGYCAA